MRYCSAFMVVFLASVPLRGAQGSGADRTLLTIDFEERARGNAEDLPMYWSKIEGEGMPHYVNGRLADDAAHGGKFSFRFDLNGGSLIYRYDPLRIPVHPRSHYRVEGYVKTTVLRHARARLTGYFLDADRRPILSTITHSELYTATTENEPWHLLAAELSTEKSAAFLAVELELVQPQHYSTAPLGTQELFPQDIRGTAWFDDVSISQAPRVKMSTDRPGNIFRRGEALSLGVVVTDRSTDDLIAQLVITDAAGKTIYQRSGALDISAAESLGPGHKRMRLLLPELPAGWYEASLVMNSRGKFVGRQRLDLVLLADGGTTARPDDRFGVVATDLPFDGWAELPQILPYLGVARVKLGVWSSAGDIQQIDSAGFDQLLLQLAELGITPTACLLEPPPDLARKLGGSSWLKLLEAKGDDWRPQLSHMIARHANHLDRWQIGADGSDVFATQPQMREVYQLLYGQFAKLVQTPDLAMPWPVWCELESAQMPATIALSVEAAVLPHQLPLYMQDMGQREGRNLALTLQLRDRQRYGRELQIQDLAQRVIYALAADARRIDVALPFTVVREEGSLVKQPQELLLILRTLTTTLGGSTFKGKVPVAEGVEAFLFDRDGQGILALWDRGPRGSVRQLPLSLGERARAVDLWGNVTPLLRPLTNGQPAQQVQLNVSSMPMFLIDIDGQFAQLRASLAFDQPLIESSFRPHTRRIHFINPYRTAISGSLKLKGPAGWTISPPVLSFNVNPGETFEREVSIEFPYNSFAGNKTVLAELSLQDARCAGATTVPLTLKLGLSDVGMQTLAARNGKTVLVQQIITNYGERNIDYTAFALLSGFPREERIVTNLGPGRTTIKLYRFQDVKGELARVRTGIRQMQGTRVLNDEVEVQQGYPYNAGVNDLPYIRLDSSLPGEPSWIWPGSAATLMLRCDGPGRTTVLSKEGRVLRQWAEPLDALSWLGEDVLQRGEAGGRWIGCLSYDLGRLFEVIPSMARDDLGLPLFVFTWHEPIGRSGHLPIGPSGDGQWPDGQMNQWPDGAAPIRSTFTRTEYEAAVARVVEYIAAGDIFQVNLSQRFSAGLRTAPSEVYRRLQEHFPAWYGAYLDYGDHALLCNSPELFLRITPDSAGRRRIVTRPIKGTRPLGAGQEFELLHSIKDQAELNMIVDLERNDLGRICQIGSVVVSEPRVIEAHPTLYHGVATVEGTLREDVGFVDILRATFPGGSITGAPKIRAMQIIEELEPVRRGPYCGAIGYLSQERIEFNIAIRTMIVRNGAIHMPVGGGIVADSTPAAEYEETLVKAAAMFAAAGVELPGM